MRKNAGKLLFQILQGVSLINLICTKNPKILLLNHMFTSLHVGKATMIWRSENLFLYLLAAVCLQFHRISVLSNTFWLSVWSEMFT